MEKNYRRQKINILTLLPIILILIYFSGIDQLYYSKMVVDTAHNPLKQIILGSSYFIAVIILCKNFKLLIPIFKKTFLNYLILIFMLISGCWVLFPMKVIINFIHGLGTSLAITVGVQYIRYNEKKFFNIASIIIIISVLMSFFAAKYFPNMGTDYTGKWGQEKLRWTGVFFYPNSLGLLCMISIWFLLSSLYKGQSNIMKLTLLVGLTFTSITLFNSNSMTAIICSIIIFISFPFLMIFKNESVNIQISLLLMIILIFAVTLLILILYRPDIFSLDYFFSVIDRDSSLTGRDKIWYNGFQLFLKNPIFGWGFDYMGTLKESGKSIGVSQYHNGYLTLLIEGGVLAFTLFSLMVLRVLKIVYKTFKNGNKESAITILIFTISMLIRNITESSLLRYVNYMWFLFILNWIYLEYVNLIDDSDIYDMSDK